MVNYTLQVKLLASIVALKALTKRLEERNKGWLAEIERLTPQVQTLICGLPQLDERLLRQSISAYSVILSDLSVYFYDSGKGRNKTIGHELRSFSIDFRNFFSETRV